MILTTVITVLIDQICKYKVEENIKQGEYKEIVKDKFYLTNMKNKGMAMGSFSDNRGLVVFGSVLSLLVVAFMWHDAVKHNRGELHNIAVALVAGGGISNVYDRIVKGEVTDYLYIKREKAPIFNIADVAVLIGFIVSIIDFIKEK